MRLPTICGVIDRRILVNYRIDPPCIQRVLPPPFQPQLVNGYAIGGICLIRLSRIRPAQLPIPWGIASENAAHRIAVQWDTPTGLQQGVYIPRRDTNSRLNAWAGGRVFPGKHHHARFSVYETPEHYSVAMTSNDGAAHVRVAGRVADAIPAESTFGSLDAASAFFVAGSLGYSNTNVAGRYDGIELACDNWRVTPLDIEQAESSYFDDRSRFPAGSTNFDCALLMRGITHQWHGRPDLCVSPEEQPKT